MAKKSNWIAKAAKSISEKGTEGAFTAQAHAKADITMFLLMPDMFWRISLAMIQEL